MKLRSAIKICNKIYDCDMMERLQRRKKYKFKTLHKAVAICNKNDRILDDQRIVGNVPHFNDDPEYAEQLGSLINNALTYALQR